MPPGKRTDRYLDLVADDIVLDRWGSDGLDPVMPRCIVRTKSTFVKPGEPAADHGVVQSTVTPFGGAAVVAQISARVPFDVSAKPEGDDDKLITLREACRLLPGRNGRPISLGAVYRWSMHGCRGVRLATWQSGSFRCTSRQAVREFIAALTARRDGQPVEARMPPTVAKRRADVARRLDAIGI